MVSVTDNAIQTKGFWEIVRDLPTRLIAMISKMIGVKGLIFAVATYMTYLGKIETWGFVVVALFFVVGREIFKYLKDIR
jgi:hypothetical protein